MPPQIPDGLKDVQVFIDPAVPEIESFAAEWKTSMERARWLASIASAIRAAVASPSVNRSGSCDNVSVQRYATEAHAQILRAIESQAVSLSQRRWINYARRLPATALTDGPDEPVERSNYPASLLDAATALYGSPVDEGTETNRFEVVRQELPVVGKVVDGARLAAEVQQLYRQAGRGARYVLRSGSPIPIRAFDAAFEAANADYHRRINSVQESGDVAPLTPSIT